MEPIKTRSQYINSEVRYTIAMVLFYILGLILMLSAIGQGSFTLSLAGMVPGLFVPSIGYLFQVKCRKTAAQRTSMFPESKTRSYSKKC